MRCPVSNNSSTIGRRRGVALKQLVSEVPGTVWKIEAQIGTSVSDGDVVLILESMKMEIPVQVGFAGVITAILVKEGDFVGDGDAVAELEV